LRAALAADGTPPQLKAALAKRIEQLEKRQAAKAPSSAPQPKPGHYYVEEPGEAGRRSAKMKIKRWSDAQRRYV